jgi:hypothetical protein
MSLITAKRISLKMCYKEVETDLPNTSATFGFAIGCLVGRNDPATGSQEGNTDRY